jgi:hypothetical protein
MLSDDYIYFTNEFIRLLNLLAKLGVVQVMHRSPPPAYHHFRIPSNWIRLDRSGTAGYVELVFSKTIDKNR